MNRLGYDNAFSEVSLYTTHRVVTFAHKIDSKRVHAVQTFFLGSCYQEEKLNKSQNLKKLFDFL